MRRLKILAALIAVGMLSVLPSTLGAQSISIFVFAGQSNAVGYATDFNLLTTDQKAAQPKVLYAGQAYTGNFDPGGALNPISWGTINGATEIHSSSFPINSGHGFGPELSAPLTISKGLMGSKVGAVKFAVNNTGFGADIAPLEGDWSAPGGNLYNSLTTRVNNSITALPSQQPGTTGGVAGLFWMQGERDAL